ncbi:MAG: SAM-dependent methyltransferase [Rhizobiales bacterium PAR1]|nr:MAG: SAM-dependent methyltransferase [Rhizobiales bacterium PAR1]
MSFESSGRERATAAAALPQRKVLHVGCGPRGLHRLHPVFHDLTRWREIRLDLDPSVEPDIVCSTADMRGHIANGTVDALWSSHNIEHLYDHDVSRALSEFARVLRPDGFALIRCPDLESVVTAILQDGLETIAYHSPAGPITPLDMLYGHRASVARGNDFMAHKTGFTDLRLGRLLLEAGFAHVNTKRATGFDLWAIAFMPEANPDETLDALACAGLSFES